MTCRTHAIHHAYPVEADQPADVTRTSNERSDGYCCDRCRAEERE